MNSPARLALTASIALVTILSLACGPWPVREDAGTEEDGGISADGGSVDGAMGDDAATGNDAATGDDATTDDDAGGDPGCETGGAATEAEPNEDHHGATRVSSGVSITGNIGAEGDQDWFLISVCSERIIKLELTNAPAFTSDVDYQFDLFDVDGATELGEEWDYGDGGTVEIERNYYVPGAGVYFVRVMDRYDSSADPQNDYSLIVTALDVPDGDFEPNGDSANPDELRTIATPVASGVETAGYIASEGDDDWYAITVTGESILQVDLTNAPAVSTPVNLQFDAFDTDADTELGEEWAYGDQTVSLTRNYYLPEAGTYYVRVMDRYETDYDYEQPYLLTLTELPVPDGDFEPNGDSSNPDFLKTIATPVGSGVETAGFIASEGDDDWYAITVTGESILQVDLTNAPAVSTPVNLQFDAFDTDADTEMGEEWDYGDETVSLTRNYYLPEAGTYYVRVMDRYETDYDYAQPYLLTLTERAVPDGDFEPNGNSDNPDYIKTIATPIASSSPVVGYIASEGDDDWYKVSPQAAGSLTVGLTNAPAFLTAVNFQLEVYDSDADTRIGDEDWDYGDQGTVVLSRTITASAGQDYFIRVMDRYANDYDYDQPYTLTVTFP